MPTIDQISETVFRETISRAVQDVFKTMLGKTATLADTADSVLTENTQWEHPVQITGQQVVGTVGFIGDISGLIYLYLDAAFANEHTRQTQGTAPVPQVLEELEPAFGRPAGGGRPVSAKGR